MKVRFFIVLVCCVCSLSIHAEDKYAYLSQHNELRIGWGDQLFESLVWHNPTAITTTMPESYRRTYHEDYHHDQHIWLEYQNRPKGWFSYGGMADISFVDWDDVTRNGKGSHAGGTG